MTSNEIRNSLQGATFYLCLMYGDLVNASAFTVSTLRSPEIVSLR